MNRLEQRIERFVDTTKAPNEAEAAQEFAKDMRITGSREHDLEDYPPTDTPADP